MPYTHSVWFPSSAPGTLGLLSLLTKNLPHLKKTRQEIPAPDNPLAQPAARVQERGGTPTRPVERGGSPHDESYNPAVDAIPEMQTLEIEEEPDPGPTELETDAVAVEAPAPSRWAGILRERGPTGRVLMSVGTNMSLAIDSAAPETQSTNSLPDPKNRREAMAAPDKEGWIEAERGELSNHERNCSFEIMNTSQREPQVLSALLSHFSRLRTRGRCST